MARRLRDLADDGYWLSREQWAFVFETERGCRYELTKAEARGMGLCEKCASDRGSGCMAYLACSEWCSWPKDRALGYLEMCRRKEGKANGRQGGQA